MEKPLFQCIKMQQFVNINAYRVNLKAAEENVDIFLSVTFDKCTCTKLFTEVIMDGLILKFIQQW